MTLQMHYQEKYEQGIEQGIEREKIDSAMRMIEDGGLPLEKVAVYSGLTLEQVLELEKRLQLAECLLSNPIEFPMLKTAVPQVFAYTGQLF